MLVHITYSSNRAKEVEFTSIKANITTRDEDSIISSLEKELAKMSNKCMKAENEVKKKEVCKLYLF